MRTLIEILASLAILANAVIYGTSGHRVSAASPALVTCSGPSSRPTTE